MKVLAVEISSDAGSLALVEDGGVVASVPMDARQRRSQGLFDAGGALLSGAGWGWEALGAFAVGRGPGSYTGLRVSLTAACG
ncbi:MAG TPA: tRNA (adenosine(37)-N6)-threonylcarbamoyltransferase complex dimerization subunit type 1 TsaB, partial [Kiritimatiellia bacterium]|nr:tRNA (adenosine(37)-N6)-threonylcarbamoyltransferase complex dimerization subunit type 1 TsaB [Kiritimatiellia bacterium]